jgi:hypothetical protein
MLTPRLPARFAPRWNGSAPTPSCSRSWGAGTTRHQMRTCSACCGNATRAGRRCADRNKAGPGASSHFTGISLHCARSATQPIVLAPCRGNHALAGTRLPRLPTTTCQAPSRCCDGPGTSTTPRPGRGGSDGSRPAAPTRRGAAGPGRRLLPGDGPTFRWRRLAAAPAPVLTRLRPEP